MKFYAKVLLFGEHLVNKGADALAIPFDQYYCTLTRNKEESSIPELSIEILQKIVKHIKTSDTLTSWINVPRMEADIDEGLYINMNIPIGYGLGSSGALVACVFEKYKVKTTDDLVTLKSVLGGIESVFHGKSSGLDPLVSYLNQPVLIRAGNTSLVTTSNQYRDYFDIVLVDTEQPRKTEPLVKHFMEKCEEGAFNQIVTEELVPLNNMLVALFLNEKWEALELAWKELSSKQLEHLPFLILEKHKSIWQQGLSQNKFYFKICGAGGGGFMLVLVNKGAELPPELSRLVL